MIPRFRGLVSISGLRSPGSFLSGFGQLERMLVMVSVDFELMQAMDAHARKTISIDICSEIQSNRSSLTRISSALRAYSAFQSSIFFFISLCTKSERNSEKGPE